MAARDRIVQCYKRHYPFESPELPSIQGSQIEYSYGRLLRCFCQDLYLIVARGSGVEDEVHRGADDCGLEAVGGRA